MYCASSKTNSNDVYSGVPPSCSHVSAEPTSTTDTSVPLIGEKYHHQLPLPSCQSPISTSATLQREPQRIRTICLSKKVLALLNSHPAHSFPASLDHCRVWTSLLVADTRATDHMKPDKLAFISYYLITGCHVRMGNNSFAPILGHGSAIVSLNGKRVLIRDCCHVLDLRNPLYSLRAHQHQRHCGSIGMYGLGMYIFFQTFILEVDTSTDCHLQYEPIGHSAKLADLDYVQPKKAKACSALVTVAPPIDLVLVEPDKDDNTDLPLYASHYPKKPPSPPTLLYNLINLPPPAYSVSLKDLDCDKLIQQLYSLEHPLPAGK
jgi:hypothetical protein